MKRAKESELSGQQNEIALDEVRGGFALQTLAIGAGIVGAVHAVNRLRDGLERNRQIQRAVDNGTIR